MMKKDVFNARGSRYDLDITFISAIDSVVFKTTTSIPNMYFF